MRENFAYQEARREEWIDGSIVAMSPRPAFNHNQVSYNIARIFGNYLYGKKCTPIADGMDLYLDDDNLFVPDFMVVCDPEKLKPDGVHGTPDLEYWLVSPEEKSVEIYRTNGAELILHDIYALHPDWQLAQMTHEERAAVVTHFQCSLFPDLEIPLADLFYRTF